VDAGNWDSLPGCGGPIPRVQDGRTVDRICPSKGRALGTGAGEAAVVH